MSLLSLARHFEKLFKWHTNQQREISCSSNSTRCFLEKITNKSHSLPLCSDSVPIQVSSWLSLSCVWNNSRIHNPHNPPCVFILYALTSSIIIMYNTNRISYRFHKQMSFNCSYAAMHTMLDIVRFFFLHHFISQGINNV